MTTDWATLWWTCGPQATIWINQTSAFYYKIFLIWHCSNLDCVNSGYSVTMLYVNPLQSCFIIILIYTTVQTNSPGWIVKSSTGTELAVWPMCCSTSSSRPVETQVMLLGSPSDVKKSKKTNKKLL